MPQLPPPPPRHKYLSLLKPFLCHFNHPHDFHPLLRTVIAHRCVMSAFVAIIPRPVIVSGQHFPSFLICHRGRGGGGGEMSCARINRKMHSVIAQQPPTHAFAHYSNWHLCLLHSMMTICCYMSIHVKHDR